MLRVIQRILSGLGRLHEKVVHWLLKLDIERFLTFGFISSVPQRQLTMGYFSYFIIGGALLCLPFMTFGNVSLVDNLFTAMSALSTTGLSTVDVATAYSFSGQLFILLMIQLGGLGYMTISTFVMYSVTRHFIGTHAKAFQTQFALPESISAGNMARNIVLYTFIIEGLGILGLYVTFLFYGIPDALWSATFHAISAFCTAGFSLYTDNLMQFSCNVPVNLIIIFLSYAGAMGFIVISDLWNKLVKKHYHITFTTRVILIITLLITLWGTFHLYFFESTFDHFNPGERLLVSLFQTMSAMTTVGFNTVDLSGVMPLSLFVLTVVMYLGASPSGTGGGLKSTTLSALYVYLKAKLGRKPEYILSGRRIPDYRIYDAVTIFIFYTIILFIGSYLLMITEGERFQFLPLMFEAASALGTVGLTSGVCLGLTVSGKIILIVLMFVGRVGVLTIGNVMLMRMSHHDDRLYSRDDLAV